VPFVRHTRNSDKKRRREKISLILAPGTFSLGLQTQDCPFVKLCLDLGQLTPPLERERRNESPHQHSTPIRFAQSVVANQRNVRTVRGKVPSPTALVVTLLRCYAFHFWMSTPWLAHYCSINRTVPSHPPHPKMGFSTGPFEKSLPRPTPPWCSPSAA
jgi:hypothetical protein